MKSEGVFSRIISSLLGEKVAVRENFFYNGTRKRASDFALDDLINKQAALDLISASGGTPTNIIAGTTVTPLVIAYAATSFPDYVLIRGSDDSFDKDTNVQYDGTQFTINGNDDGTGHFADSYTFAIKS